MSFFLLFFIALYSACGLPLKLVRPVLIKELFLFIVLGLAGGVANLLLTQSYRLADASLVSPIKYLSLLFALFFGYYIWNEIPKPMMLFGATLVILSSLIIFKRESKLKKQPVSPRV